jgi:hypothetical protein
MSQLAYILAVAISDSAVTPYGLTAKIGKFEQILEFEIDSAGGTAIAYGCNEFSNSQMVVSGARRPFDEPATAERTSFLLERSTKPVLMTAYFWNGEQSRETLRCICRRKSATRMRLPFRT